MNVDSFFKHWGLTENPFSAEEAKNDPVYHRMLDEHMTHPDFDKIYGAPSRPSTSVVFGDKGSGKTAIRLLIEKRIEDHNRDNLDQKVWLVRNDDLNPFIDSLAHSLGKPADEALSDIKLSDHQDAILSNAVTRLVDFLMGDDLGIAKPKPLRKRLRRMDSQKRVDLAQLAAIYDNPTLSNPMKRWGKLKMMLRTSQFLNLRMSAWISMIFLGASVGIGAMCFLEPESWKLKALCGGTGLAFLLTAWTWFTQMIRIGKLSKKIHKEVRVVHRDPKKLSLRLSDIPYNELSSQPMPTADDQDARYELTSRLLRILDEINFVSIVVLYDRIDEPVAVNGDAKKMKSIIWPIFQNKFLQQERIGIKMLMPLELSVMLKKEDAEFYQHARLDKQNMIERLVWSGTTLYDICSKRMSGCQGPEPKIKKLTDLFEEDVTSTDVIDALDQMMQPRDAFKFMYKVIQEHCHNSSDEEPQWRIPKHVLENIRKQQSQRVQELSRGMVPA